jgi:hypothetical protein
MWLVPTHLGRSRAKTIFLSGIEQIPARYLPMASKQTTRDPLIEIHDVKSK